MLQGAFLLLDYQTLYPICCNKGSQIGVHPREHHLQDSFGDVSTVQVHEVQENIAEQSQFINPNTTTAKPYNILLSEEQFTPLYIKQQFS